MKHIFVLLFLLPMLACAQHMGTSRFEVKELPKPPVKIVEIDSFVDKFGIALTPQQREWFYWTNYSRSNPRRFWDSVVAPIVTLYPHLNKTNTSSLKEDLYNSPALPLLKPNRDLAKVAAELAQSLAEKKATPSHTSPSGRTFEDRMKSISVKRCAGENISFGPPQTLLMLVLLYIDEGVPDKGHRKSLLTAQFKEMGIGIGNYPDNKFMIVQDFACAQD